MAVQVSFVLGGSRSSSALSFDPRFIVAPSLALVPTATWVEAYHNTINGLIVARINTDDTSAMFAVGATAPTDDTHAFVFSGYQQGEINIDLDQRIYIKAGGTSLLTGTRAYGTGIRQAVGSTTAQTAVIAASEVLLHASTRCFVKSGSNPVAVATGDSIPLEAGEKFHMRITSGHKIAVIRDTADGFLHIVPVV